jgi:hypothetical protein
VLETHQEIRLRRTEEALKLLPAVLRRELLATLFSRRGNRRAETLAKAAKSRLLGAAPLQGAAATLTWWLARGPGAVM